MEQENSCRDFEKDGTGIAEGGTGPGRPDSVWSGGTRPVYRTRRQREGGAADGRGQGGVACPLNCGETETLNSTHKTSLYYQTRIEDSDATL